MCPMKLVNKSNILYLIPIFLYLILSILSLNYCYFWDNIQQTSIEGHWFYLTNFKSLLIPAQSPIDGISATGYHPPLMGLMTALLWKLLGYKLWVSHFLVFVWAIILFWNLRKLLSVLLPEQLIIWTFAIILVESALLTQYTIASPDFILFTAFIVALRAILENKKIILSVAVFFLCCISMRGVFAGVILYFANNYYQYLLNSKKLDIKSAWKVLIPYIPTLLILSVYYIIYFVNKGWFFEKSEYAEHYIIPNSMMIIFKHIAEFVLRSIENGRIFIWGIGVYLTFRVIKEKIELNTTEKVLILIFTLLTALYILFIFITKMPFSQRYFLPQFSILTILIIIGMNKLVQARKVRILMILILLFELSGNLWVYPEKMAKAWDCTLAHLPYYELRKECFNYIDAEKIPYAEISSGFCFYGNRQFIELASKRNVVDTDMNTKYFIYSNISNLRDEQIDLLKNPNLWKPLKSFKKHFVYITIYERNEE